MTNSTLTTETVAAEAFTITGDAIPLALTGMGIVFTALSIIAFSIFLLPRVLKLVNPYLPAEPELQTSQALPGTQKVDEARRITAAITAAMHRHRSQN